AVFIARRALGRETLRQMFVIPGEQVHRHAAAASHDFIGVTLHIDRSQDTRRREGERTHRGRGKSAAPAFERARDDGDAAGQQAHGIAECGILGRHGSVPPIARLGKTNRFVYLSLSQWKISVARHRNGKLASRGADYLYIGPIRMEQNYCARLRGRSSSSSTKRTSGDSTLCSLTTRSIQNSIISSSCHCPARTWLYDERAD